MFRIASSQASCSKTKPAFLLNFCIAQRYDAFCTQTRHISQLKITDVIFPSCGLFYLQSFEVNRDYAKVYIFVSFCLCSNILVSYQEGVFPQGLIFSKNLMSVFVVISWARRLQNLLNFMKKYIRALKFYHIIHFMFVLILVYVWINKCIGIYCISISKFWT